MKTSEKIKPNLMLFIEMRVRRRRMENNRNVVEVVK